MWTQVFIEVRPHLVLYTQAPLIDRILNIFLLLSRSIVHDLSIVQPTSWPYSYMYLNVRVAPLLCLGSRPLD